jgi:hypothetical protein
LIDNRVVSIRVNSPAHLAALEALLPDTRQQIEEDEVVDTMVSVLHGGEARGPRRPFHLLYLNHRQVARAQHFEVGLAALREALNVRLTGADQN